MIRIPEHLLAGVPIAFARTPQVGVSGWRTAATTTPYWSGLGYVSAALKSKVDLMKASGSESAVLTGVVLFDLEPAPAGGEWPRASDTILLNGVEAELISVRPPGHLIGYWKAEVRTGPQ